MPSSSRELQVYPCIPRLTECFGAGPSGGNFLVPARKLIRSRLKGRCRKAAPLRIPRPLRRNCVRFFRLAMGGSVENSLKDTLSLRTSPQTGVAIRSPSLPLGEGGSRVPRKCETDEGKIKKATSSARPAPSPLRRRHWGTDCHVGRWPPRNDIRFRWRSEKTGRLPHQCCDTGSQ